MTDTAAVPRRPRDAVRQAWIDRLQRFDAGACSVADFCRAEGVATQTFYYWRNKLAAAQHASDPTPHFLPIRVLSQAAPVELVLPGGAVLRLAPGCDLAFVRSLLDALGLPARLWSP
jgi:transposase-like protein